MEIRGPFGIPLPPEIVAQIQAQYDLDQMRGDAYRHEIHSILESMNEDQLRLFAHVLHNITSVDTAEEKTTHSAWYEGIIAGVLMRRFNICPACGLDHDKAAADMAEGESESSEEEKLTDAVDADLDPEEYDLWFDPEQGWLCKNCGKHYPSVTDRALRPKGVAGCPGCVHKAQWG